MKKINMKLIVFLVALITFGACKKQTTVTEPVKKNNQKMIGADLNQTLAEIKKFKAAHEVKASPNVQARLSLKHYLDQDSAVWVVEACLNYDFDYAVDGDSLFSVVDSVAYPSAVAVNSSGKISDTDIMAVYNYITDSCNARLSRTTTSLIRVIDIVTQTSSTGGIFFKAYIGWLTYDRPAFPYIPGCVSINQSADWSVAGCNLTGYDAITFVKNRLNCVNVNGHGCYGAPVWYSDVLTVNFSGDGNAYSSALYYLSTNASYNCTVLNSTQQNNYVTGCQNLSSANLPYWGGAGPGYSVANYNLYPAQSIVTPNYHYFWWYFITYGRGFCSRSAYPF